MFLQHYGSLAVSVVLIVFSIIASYWVWQARRPHGSPRWPLLTFFGSFGIRGLAYFLLSIHFSTAASAIDIVSNAVLWFAVGALLTQWFHQTVLHGEPVRR